MLNYLWLAIRGGHRIQKPLGRWSTFLSRTLLRARGASFFISRFVQSRMQLSPRIVKYLSQSLVNSICEYGVQIWGPFLCSQADLRKHLTAIDTLKFSVLRSSLGLHRYYPSLPRKSYWHPTSSFLLRTDMGVAPMRHRCAELLFAYWNTSLAFNKDCHRSPSANVGRTFMPWHLPPLTLIAGSLMPEHSSLPLDCLPILMSVARSSMAAYVSPSSNMEPPMSLLNVARGLPTRPLLLHPVASVRKQ